MTLIPISDLEIIDDWYTSGLRGSGSVTTIAKDVFVPAERVLPMEPVLQHVKTPFMPTACTTVSAVALGLANAAKDAFFERLPGRRITFTSYERQSEAPVTHLEVAEATTKIDETGFHAYRAADMIDTKGASGEPWTLEERARVRLDLGAACQRAMMAWISRCIRWIGIEL